MKIFLLTIAAFSIAFANALDAAPVPIIVDPSATSTEHYAARQLSDFLQQISGQPFPVQESASAPSRAIIVGSGAAARHAFAKVPFDGLGPEELVMQTKGHRLLLAGGRPRGALYAVGRFLQEQCGVRWWTPWASRVPLDPDFRLPAKLDVREKPAFEYREPFWIDSFDPDWAWRNTCNGASQNIPADKGGHVTYKGFVHTSYPLVPPDKYFASHPEWFALVDGKRADHDAQLCLSNPQLRDFVVDRVKQWLRESPDAGIISVSQNDCAGWCQCPACSALDDAEGSHAASMIDFVNYVAEKIEPEFPRVAVDTLAYQYTRHAPKTLRPRPNVIVRLCSIECNFHDPLDDPSNAKFTDDLRDWAKRADRLYIWDYVTDFAHYIQPQPNWFVLGPNLRLFASNHVRGVFEEGASQTYGPEMAELRAWVLAQLLWNPNQDDRALIREFLDGYYGPAGAPIAQYMDALDHAAAGVYVGCYSAPDAKFLQFAPLAQAEQYWQQAEQAVAHDPEFLARVRLGHLPVRYVFLSQWDSLRAQCAAANARWPLSENRETIAAEWREVAAGSPNRPWTKVTQINEPGETTEQFLTSVTKK